MYSQCPTLTLFVLLLSFILPPISASAGAARVYRRSADINGRSLTASRSLTATSRASSTGSTRPSFSPHSPFNVSTVNSSMLYGSASRSAHTFSGTLASTGVAMKSPYAANKTINSSNRYPTAGGSQLPKTSAGSTGTFNKVFTNYSRSFIAASGHGIGMAVTDTSLASTGIALTSFYAANRTTNSPNRYPTAGRSHSPWTSAGSARGFSTGVTNYPRLSIPASVYGTRMAVTNTSLASTGVAMRTAYTANRTMNSWNSLATAGSPQPTMTSASSARAFSTAATNYSRSAIAASGLSTSMAATHISRVSATTAVATGKFAYGTANSSLPQRSGSRPIVSSLPVMLSASSGARSTMSANRTSSSTVPPGSISCSIPPAVASSGLLMGSLKSNSSLPIWPSITPTLASVLRGPTSRSLASFGSGVPFRRNATNSIASSTVGSILRQFEGGGQNFLFGGPMTPIFSSTSPVTTAPINASLATIETVLQGSASIPVTATGKSPGGFPLFPIVPPIPVPAEPVPPVPPGIPDLGNPFEGEGDGDSEDGDHKDNNSDKPNPSTTVTSHTQTTPVSVSQTPGSSVPSATSFSTVTVTSSSSPLLSVTATSATIPSSSTACATCDACADASDYQQNNPSYSGDTEDSDYTKREIIRRFYKEKRDVEKRALNHVQTADVVAKVFQNPVPCKVLTYNYKPVYPGPKDVEDAENRMLSPQMMTQMSGFLSKARWWAVPINAPKPCQAPQWKLLSTNTIRRPGPNGEKAWAIGGLAPRSVNIDHVYEYSMLDEFFVKQEVQNGFDCQDMSTLFDPSDTVDGRGTRLNTIFGQLASVDNPDFLGMSAFHNKLKGNLWNPNLHGLRPIPNNVNAMISYLKDISIVMNMVNHPDVVQLWQNTNARIYQAFLGIDNTIQDGLASCPFSYADHNGQPMAATWGQTYKDYVVSKVSDQNAQVASVWASLSSQVPTATDHPMIAKQPNLWPLVPQWKAFMVDFNLHYNIQQMAFPAAVDWPVVPLVIGKRDNNGSAAACPLKAPVTATGAVTSTTPSTQRTPPAVLPLPPTTTLTRLNTTATATIAVVSTTSSIRITTPAVLPQPPNTTPASFSKTVILSVSVPNASFIDPSQPPNDPPTGMEGVGHPAPLPFINPSQFPNDPPTGMEGVGHLASLPSAPSLSPQSSTTPAAAPDTPATNPDPCGPVEQKPSYFNTCNTTVPLVGNPSQYGVMCQNYGTEATNWAQCANAYTKICYGMGANSSSKWETDQWIWLQEPGCTVGAWIPGGPNAAPLPSEASCNDNIFGSMVNFCSVGETSGVDVFNVATVNLKQWPSFSEANYTGEQVEFGYPSYVLLAQQKDGYLASVPFGESKPPWYQGPITARQERGNCPERTCYDWCVCE